jgi:uncharacterized protein DUF6335
MAKRKATRALRRRPGQAGRKKSGGRKAAGRGRAASRKTVRRKRTAPKRRVAAKSARKARKPAAKRPIARRRPVAKVSKPARRRLVAKARPVVKARPVAKPRPVAKAAAPTAATAAGGRAPKRSVPILRKPPSLDRERRIVLEEDIIQSTPPSSLDLNRSASAVRTGRRALKDKYDEHTETSPALTAGDVDADWESAYAVGDEAPGGDNPTPDQDIVDDIGKAVGVEYQDNEELKGEEKIIKRDKNRWELDPASSDDWDDR